MYNHRNPTYCCVLTANHRKITTHFGPKWILWDCVKIHLIIGCTLSFRGGEGLHSFTRHMDLNRSFATRSDHAPFLAMSRTNLGFVHRQRSRLTSLVSIHIRLRCLFNFYFHMSLPLYTDLDAVSLFVQLFFCVFFFIDFL